MDWFRALLSDVKRVLGPDHPDTLRVRYHIARWTAKTGDDTAALVQFRALLPKQEQAQGVAHPRTQETRDWMAKLEAGGKASPDGSKLQSNAPLDFTAPPPQNISPSVPEQ